MDFLSEADKKKWSLPKLFAFRFVAVCFVIDFPFIAGPLWSHFVLWVGKRILNINDLAPISSTSSGDTLYDYVGVLAVMLASFMVATLWSLFDSKRPNYSTLYKWFRLYIHVTLAGLLIYYGSMKVIPIQFPPLTLADLVVPYGDSSPMGVLWKFMQTSQPFTICTGIVEMIAGFLLLVPRLTLLGALLSSTIMTHVFILNMSYDVSVKIFSFKLVLMSILLVLPDLQRLARFFVLNRAVEPCSSPDLFKNKLLNQAVLAILIVYGAYQSFVQLEYSYKVQESYSPSSTEIPFYGIWKVKEFYVDDKIHLPLLGDEIRWNQFIVFNRISIRVQMMNNKFEYFGEDFNRDTNSFSLKNFENSAFDSKFTLEKLDGAPSKALVRGVINGQTIKAILEKIDEQNFILLSRGFRWVSDYPYHLPKP